MKIYTLHYCDEWKSFSSVDIAEEYFADMEEGRESLVEELIAGINDKTIELDGSLRFLVGAILAGNIREANGVLKYVYINTLAPTKRELGNVGVVKL